MPLGAATGASVVLREDAGGVATTTRYVIVNLGRGRVYQVLLQAPADQWGQHASTLDGILQSIQFPA